KAAGVQCYAATNLEKSVVDYLAEEKGLKKLFDGIFSSSSVGYSKSDPKFFETVLALIGNPLPEEVLFWDDSIENVEIARSLGIKAELYTSFDDFQKKMKELASS
ncbi:MAG: HAD-IA family hydrolase, partial [Candidatus Wildermuthbacteria bacterium]|nr:HAD-IA family hydrolase [Candidatus Wildermuthbacteria bacterium]